MDTPRARKIHMAQSTFGARSGPDMVRQRAR